MRNLSAASREAARSENPGTAGFSVSQTRPSRAGLPPLEPIEPPWGPITRGPTWPPAALMLLLLLQRPPGQDSSWQQQPSLLLLSQVADSERCVNHAALVESLS
ncbi:hypothetical protein HPB50_025721 [Hyalomma asiaticum]|uniref:Uncharacterized protein n=1 Tax=Hyalomma asiaticum TaxID=266040 RepID=A0ACB7RTR2_HYAAI|nr:hypothetical protein HPB50_025721 [Hyalomma asiaticum]